MEEERKQERRIKRGRVESLGDRGRNGGNKELDMETFYGK